MRDLKIRQHNVFLQDSYPATNELSRYFPSGNFSGPKIGEHNVHGRRQLCHPFFPNLLLLPLIPMLLLSVYSFHSCSRDKMPVAFTLFSFLLMVEIDIANTENEFPRFLRRNKKENALFECVSFG